MNNEQPAPAHAVDRSKGFEGKGGAGTQASQRIAAPDVTPPEMSSLKMIAGLAAIPTTSTLSPAQSLPTAGGPVESFLSGPSLEADGASAGSRPGARLGTPQGTANGHAQLLDGAAAPAIAPVASRSMGNEGRAGSGAAVAAHQVAPAEEETGEIGFQEAASSRAHVTGGDGSSEGGQNRNPWALPSKIYPGAGADGFLSAHQPIHGTQASDANAFMATDIAGRGKLQPAPELPSAGLFRKTTRTADAAEAAQPGAHSLSPQCAGWAEAGGPGTFGAILPHDPGVARTAPEALHNSGAALTENARSGVQETFTALDAGAGPGTMGWVHAGPQRAEAGFEDPALGWIGVRANLSAGAAVHAAVLAGSSEAAQALGGQLAGLNAYLTEHHAGVASLTMTSSDGGSASWGNSPSAMDQESSGNSAQRGASESQMSRSYSPPVTTREIPPQSGGLEAAPPEIRQGRHISVIA